MDREILPSNMGQEVGSSSMASSLHLFSMMSLSPGLAPSADERGMQLIRLFQNCANHVVAGSIQNANIAMEHISHLASPDGDAMQRVVAYFNEALADRVLKSWRGLHKALNSTRVRSVAEEFLAKKLFNDLVPFRMLAYVITNQAILEEMKGEERVHIIDLDCFEPAQWVDLLQSFSVLKTSKFQLRITGIHEHTEVLEQMSSILRKEAQKLDIDFQFYQIVSRLEDIAMDKLRVRRGEALAISSVLQLHPLLAFDDQVVYNHSSPSPSNGSNMAHDQRSIQRNRVTLNDILGCDSSNNTNSTPGCSPDSATSSPFFIMPPKMATFLDLIRCFSPKLMVVTEQEANHSGLNLMERIDEALHFYAAFFDCFESKIPRASMERYQVEKIVFGQEIKNIVACEGVERTTRHEKLEKWIPRLQMAGFMKVNLSSNGMIQARKLLQSSNYDGYKVEEKNGFFFICWNDQPLFSVSAWRFLSLNLM